MLDLTELQQFVTYAHHGTLSKTAEVLHISQPTLTRTMHHIEDAFGAELFQRGKNRIELTATGKLAVEKAQALLAEAEAAVQSVQAFERSLHTITINSCAPAPLWSLLPALAHSFPENTIASTLTEVNDIVKNIINKKADIGILPHACSDKKLLCIPYVSEQLFVCVPEKHTLACASSLSFAQLNGFNCLLRDHIGFWTALVKQKMPASRFLVQTDEFEFEELVKSSTLLSFSTNLARSLQYDLQGRKAVPLTDKEAGVTYQLICRKEKLHLLKQFTKPAIR